MDILITDWALSTYLEQKHAAIFSDAEFWNVLRPDIERLGSYPADPMFTSSKFWGPATDKAGKTIPSGFKMKWHNIGPGKIQLRLCVVLHLGQAFLCRGYVKNSVALDKREMAKLKVHISLIQSNQATLRGKL